MPARLSGQKIIQRSIDRRRATLSKDLAQLDLLLMPETSVDGAGRRDAYAIASVAEVVAHGCDEAEPYSCVIYIVVSSRPTTAMGGRSQRPALPEIGKDIGQGEIALRTMIIDFSQRHRLDKREVERMRSAPCEHPVELVVVYASEGHHVDLDRKARIGRRLDTFEDLL